MIGDIPDGLRHLQMTSMRPGAIRWSAPEQFSVDANVVAQRTTKSDIYSFGSLSLLTLSGRHPWSEVQLDIAVILRLYQGDKPDRPTFRAIEDKHWEFIERCWSKVDERPHAEDVVTSVKMFLDFCLPAEPLRQLLCIPIGSPEPLNASSPPDSRSKNSKLVHYDDTNQHSPTLPRKPSWHGDITLGLYSPIQSTPELKRRRSLDERAIPQEHASPYPDALPSFRTHPLLSGEAPPTNFYFDLASPSFSLHPGSDFQSTAIRTELRNHATDPPITRIRIIHDSIPQWPIDLGINDDQSTSHSPITVYDVLYSIYLSLHQQVMHSDWAELGQHEEAAISRVYTQRCRRVPSLADVEASRGVRRIDYLLDNHIFRGLVRTHDEDGSYCWKLILVTDLEYPCDFPPSVGCAIVSPTPPRSEWWTDAPAFHCQWVTGGTRCGAAVAGDRRSVTSHLRDWHGPFSSDGRAMACGWAGCTTSMQRRNIPRHILAFHLEVKVPCSGCGVLLSRADARKKHWACSRALGTEEDDGVY